MLGISAEAAKDWQRKAEAEFALWADRKENCDATGMNNLYGLEQLALISWLQSGDVFPVFKRYKATPLNPYSLRIHLVEADRVRKMCIRDRHIAGQRFLLACKMSLL